MNHDRSNRVCPVENAGGLDNGIRKFLQNPRKILSPYVKAGMTVLDVGCGPGVFSIEMARMVGTSGRVIAADLQDGMLEIVKRKIKGTEAEKIVGIHKCLSDRIGVTDKVDFALAFYIIHEVPDQASFFKELHEILKPNGSLLIVEPKVHVSRSGFEEMLKLVRSLHFEVAERPKVFFSRVAMLRRLA